MYFNFNETFFSDIYFAAISGVVISLLGTFFKGLLWSSTRPLPFHQRTFVSILAWRKIPKINDFFALCSMRLFGVTFKHCVLLFVILKRSWNAVGISRKKVTKSRRGAWKSVILELLDRLAALVVPVGYLQPLARGHYWKMQVCQNVS